MKPQRFNTTKIFYISYLLLNVRYFGSFGDLQVQEELAGGIATLGSHSLRALMLMKDSPWAAVGMTASYSHLATKPISSFKFHLRYLWREVGEEMGGWREGGREGGWEGGRGKLCSCLPVSHRGHLSSLLSSKRVWFSHRIRLPLLNMKNTNKLTSSHTIL